MVFSTNCKLGSVIVSAIILTLFGSVFLAYWPALFNNILNENLALTPKSRSFELWKETPIPMYIEFYFFNWTNSENFTSTNGKPILQELGPYVFKEHRRKVILDWDKDNSTVLFQQNRTWIYEPSLSNGSLHDVITTINVPAITAAFEVRKESKFIKSALNGVMKQTQLVVHKKVREFLFEGYKDPLLDFANITRKLGLPSAPYRFDKFGWLYKRNGSTTYDGIFNMYTGVDNISKLGDMHKWNHEKVTSPYPSYCGYVNGSAGELFPPKREKTSISLFSSDICRTLTLNYKEEVEVDGISGYRYWGDDTMFKNKTSIPDNWCFCVSQDCAPNGAIDVSPCMWGAPAYISFPHFYHADPFYRECVIGMNPDEDKHQMYIDLEPRTGIPLRVSAALQINILLQPWEDFSLFQDVPKIYFPTIWFRQIARIDDKIGQELKFITTLEKGGSISSTVLLSIGVTVLLIAGVYYITIKFGNYTDSENLVSS